MTTKRPRAILALATLALTTGCSEIFGSGFDYAQIEVLAVDQAGDPVITVPLTLYGKGRHFAYGRTDGSGRHVFEFVPFGGFGIAASAPVGYRFQEGSTAHRYADVEEGDRAQIEFVLERVEAVPAGSEAGTGDAGR